MRIKTIQQCQKECAINIPYQKKNEYIESRLEARLKYFDNLIDDPKNSNMEALALRKELFKLARDDAKVSQRADPFAVLSDASCCRHHKIASFIEQISEEDEDYYGYGEYGSCEEEVDEYRV